MQIFCFAILTALQIDLFVFLLTMACGATSFDGKIEHIFDFQTCFSVF